MNLDDDDDQEKKKSDDFTRLLSDSNQGQSSTNEENGRVKTLSKTEKNQDNQSAHGAEETSASSLDEKGSHNFTILITSQGQEVLKSKNE